jgi:hypothetical protein
VPETRLLSDFGICRYLRNRPVHVCSVATQADAFIAPHIKKLPCRQGGLLSMPSNSPTAAVRRIGNIAGRVWQALTPSRQMQPPHLTSDFRAQQPAGLEIYRRSLIFRRERAAFGELLHVAEHLFEQ